MAATSHSHSCSGRHAKIHSAPPRYQKAPKMQGATDNAALQRSPRSHPLVLPREYFMEFRSRSQRVPSGAHGHGEEGRYSKLHSAPSAW